MLINFEHMLLSNFEHHMLPILVQAINQAGRNNYPYNPKFAVKTGNRTRDLWFDKCIQTSRQDVSQYEYELDVSPNTMSPYHNVN